MSEELTPYEKGIEGWWSGATLADCNPFPASMARSCFRFYRGYNEARWRYERQEPGGFPDLLPHEGKFLVDVPDSGGSGGSGG